MKLLFVDVETGGLNPEKSALLQVSGMVERYCPPNHVFDKNGEITIEPLETFDFFMRPFPDDELTQRALEVNNITEADFETDKFIPPQIGYQNFKRMLMKYVEKFDKKDKMMLVGYNSHAFDGVFLDNFFRKNGDKYFGSFFWRPSIDTMLIAAFLVGRKRSKFSHFRLPDVCTYFGITVEKERLHDSWYDIELTRKLFYRELEVAPELLKSAYYL